MLAVVFHKVMDAVTCRKTYSYFNPPLHGLLGERVARCFFLALTADGGI